MPYINIKTNCEISDEKEVILKEKLGSAIGLLGKGEQWLMLSFEDNARLWMAGERGTVMAMAEVALFGKATRSQYDGMTAELSALLRAELGAETVYVKYAETPNWGYNGSNF